MTGSRPAKVSSRSATTPPQLPAFAFFRGWALRATFSESLPWLIALAASTAVFILLAWLAYPESFTVLVGLMFVFPLAIAAITFAVRFIHHQRIPAALEDFLLEPDSSHEARLARLFARPQRIVIYELAEQLRQALTELNASQSDLEDYAVSLETWVHEMKTPLSLMLLILGSRDDEMSPLVHQRMTHIHTQLTEHIQAVLYFARLRAAHKDYFFEPLDLCEIVETAIQENAASFDETGLVVSRDFSLQQPAIVLSDRKALYFILGQIISNAVKHATRLDFKLEVAFADTGAGADAGAGAGPGTGAGTGSGASANADTGAGAGAPTGAVAHADINAGAAVVLHISDNGPGVSPADLPFIFEQGFTGTTHSTGIGLYLVARQAADLNIKLSATNNPPTGLTITLIFSTTTTP